WALYDTPLTGAQVATHYARRTGGTSIVALQLIASDPDGDAITYGATGLPSGLSIEASTGLIWGALVPTSVGTSLVTVTASDGSLSASRTFTWTVTHLNRPPSLLNPGNQGSAENATISLQ